MNVANPDYKKDAPKSQPEVPTQPKQPAVSSKPKPKENTPKFPVTKTSVAPKQANAQAGIITACFTNKKGEKLSAVKVGDYVQVRLLTSNMKGKHLQYIVWEYDAVGGHDEVYVTLI